MSPTQRAVARCATISITALLLVLNACTRRTPTTSSLSLRGNGTATLSWEPPRRNLDGSPIVNLAGYFIYYGRTPTNLNVIIKIRDPFVTTYTVDGLTPGTYYFRIVAFTDSGINGSSSPTVSKTIP
jgi:hypothetical protein